MTETKTPAANHTLYETKGPSGGFINDIILLQTTNTFSCNLQMLVCFQHRFCDSIQCSVVKPSQVKWLDLVVADLSTALNSFYEGWHNEPTDLARVSLTSDLFQALVAHKDSRDKLGWDLSQVPAPRHCCSLILPTKAHWALPWWGGP